MADGDDVAAPDEEVRLAEGDAAVDELRGPRHDEERLAVLLELRALMRLLGVLDRHLVQVELLLHAAQKLRGGLVEADPDDVAGTLRPFAGILDRDVADAAAGRVDAGRNDGRIVLRPARRRGLDSRPYKLEGQVTLLQELGRASRIGRNSNKGIALACRVTAFRLSLRRSARRAQRESAAGLSGFFACASSRPNQPARSASGNSAVFPDFGGHSIEKVLLRKLLRSKSPSNAKTVRIFAPGLKSPSGMNFPEGTQPVSSSNSRFAAARTSSSGS